jgi:hypothetical protein|tara:strand:+ start:165 stop:1034 length:870 start_codon:yes stop_codon:yes gene_type:complete
MTKLYVFPESLREKSNSVKGFPHVSFEMVQRAMPEATKIHLYVPSGFTVPDGASYGSINLNEIGSSEAEVKETDTKDLANLKLGGALDAAGLGALTPAAQKEAIAKGIAINPNTAVQFETVSLRTFEFSFKMVSESAKEAQQIFLIENLFRKALYPTRQGALLKYPPTFKIKFLHGDQVNGFMPRIMESYLVSLNTTYNAGSNMYHADGSPSEVDISMTFQETELITREKLYGSEGGVSSPGSEFELDSIESEIQNRVNSLESEIKSRANEAVAGFGSAINNIASRFKL